jgi:hypothetical protein
MASNVRVRERTRQYRNLEAYFVGDLQKKVQLCYAIIVRGLHQNAVIQRLLGVPLQTFPYNREESACVACWRLKKHQPGEKREKPTDVTGVDRAVDPAHDFAGTRTKADARLKDPRGPSKEESVAAQGKAARGSGDAATVAPDSYLADVAGDNDFGSCTVDEVLNLLESADPAPRGAGGPGSSTGLGSEQGTLARGRGVRGR